MKSAKPMIPITSAQLLPYADRATTPIKKSQWAPRIASDTAKVDPNQMRESRLTAAPVIREVSLGVAASSIGNERGQLPSEDGVHILHAIRRGIQIGLFISDDYEKKVGLDMLLAKNLRRELAGGQITEMQQKSETEAAIQLSLAAGYAFWKLSQYKTDKVGDVPMELPIPIEVSLIDAPEALQCFTFYLATVLASKEVKSEAAAVKMTLVFLSKVIAEVMLKVTANSFKFVEAFTESAYKLDDEEFSFQGFDIEKGAPVSRATVAPVVWRDIVGNRPAKHIAHRQVQRLALYDFKAKRSAHIAVCGEVPLISLGKGVQGTGKTLIARAKFTELDKFCGQLGQPCEYWEMPKDIASEFQGKSAKQMVQWMSKFSDTSRIIYGLIDDAEGVLKSIEGSQSAESTEGIISVFLTFTEGASASRTGNWALDVLTNRPEKLYAPVLNRIQDKFEIEGALTIEDFLDQDKLWREKIGEQDPGFDDMIDPPKYVYLSTQGELVTLADIYAREPIEPTGELKKILEAVRKDFKEDEHMFYAQLYYRVKQAFPKAFSSRDVRNIQVAINNRRADFDVPPEWLTERKFFVDLPFEDKVKAMLAHQKEALKGLTMKSVRLQEVLRYLIVLLSIPENERQREITERREQIVRDIIANAEAQGFIDRSGGIKKLVTA